MPNAVGFDNDKYLREQSAAILERVRTFGDKLYLEFGGKLLFDYHAARVLPGFDANVKMRLLQGLREQTDVLLCIYAGDIERKKVRADFGITYDVDALKLIDEIRRGTELGRVLGNGAVSTGKKYNIERVPAVKGQAMSGYEPRSIKGTGVTYATTPQGADHTAGLTIRARRRPQGLIVSTTAPSGDGVIERRNSAASPDSFSGSASVAGCGELSSAFRGGAFGRGDEVAADRTCAFASARAGCPSPGSGSARV